MQGIIKKAKLHAGFAVKRRTTFHSRKITVTHAYPILLREIYSGFAVHKNEGCSHLFGNYLYVMFTFIAWLILFILCWPLAILALLLYPVFWILTLPFRLAGIAVDGVFSLLKGIIMLPGRLLHR